MSKRTRAVLLATVTLMLCISLIAAGTYALFTDDVKLTNHLQAGDLSITLKRTELVKTTLDTSGYLVENTVQSATDAAVNFTNSTRENVFGIEVNEKVVPGSKFVAKMQIENQSDVAFGYWIEIICKDKTKGEDLAKQVKITVNTGADKSDFVGNGLTVKGANDSYIDQLAIGATATFTVTLEFLDSAIASNNIEENNLAQGEELDFDLVVHAVQATTAPTP